ncbi:sodium:solute symporter family protein [Candidatus Halobonum tyrrellensis]|uniref:sodium:solute symporter family protein n=1 Tax=Candidatus Halobonum tyrrellensis TaxID=1431545 RepID=UPI00067787FD|nr:sodium:solute symporter family protein [Candidatus Halobonum tyrrellensis]
MTPAVPLQLGLGVDAWSLILIVGTLVVYFGVAILMHVTDTDDFYVAGRTIPASVNGAAVAADWMSAASFISLAGIVSTLGYDGTIYLMGWTGGYVVLALLIAPYLRKYGEYTIPDFIGDRYYSNTARGVAALATLFVSLTYIAGQMRGVGIVLSRFLGVDIVLGILAALALVALIGVLGGMKAITWTQAIQYFVLIVAFVIVTCAISLNLTGNPFPQMALVTSDIAGRLTQLQAEIQMGEYIVPFREYSQLQVFAIALTLMIGTAGLPHVIMRFYTVPSASEARLSAGYALFFIAILYLMVPVLAIFAKFNLIRTLNGTAVSEARSIPWVQRWTETGLLRISDANGDGVIQMTQGLTASASEVFIDPDIIVLSTPEVAGLAPIVIGVVAAGGLAAALSTADGLLIAMSSAVSHDIYYKIFRPEATQRERLIVARVVILVAAVVAAYLGINPPGFVAEVVALAFGLAAASLFPPILLGIFDERMNKEGAVSGLLVGLTFTLVLVVLMRANVVLGLEEPFLETFLGLGALGVGIYGSILNFVVAFVVSRFTPAPPEEIQELVQEVRLPRGSRDVVTGEGVEADGGVDVETDGGTDAEVDTDTTDRPETEDR